MAVVQAHESSRRMMVRGIDAVLRRGKIRAISGSAMTLTGPQVKVATVVRPGVRLTDGCLIESLSGGGRSRLPGLPWYGLGADAPAVSDGGSSVVRHPG